MSNFCRAAMLVATGAQTNYYLVWKVESMLADISQGKLSMRFLNGERKSLKEIIIFQIVARKNVQNEINTTPRARVIVMKCSAVGSLILFIINGMKLKFFWLWLQLQSISTSFRVIIFTFKLFNKFALLWGEAQLCLPYVCL